MTEYYSKHKEERKAYQKEYYRMRRALEYKKLQKEREIKRQEASVSPISGLGAEK